MSDPDYNVILNNFDRLLEQIRVAELALQQVLAQPELARPDIILIKTHLATAFVNGVTIGREFMQHAAKPDGIRNLIN